MTSYKLIGIDGREYGPVNGDQIRQWIRENRVEKQTPVLAAGTEEWTYVGLLPEFANYFPGTVAGTPPVGAPPVIQPPPATLPIGVQPREHDSMAKASMVCGILAVTLCCCCGGLPFNVLGIIFALIALVQISGTPQRHGGSGMAVVGLVLSLCSLLYLALIMMTH